MKKFGFILALICPFILFGCKHKTQENTEENNYDYPITIISDTLKTDVSDQTELFPLSEDFMESFLEKHDDYQGYKITAKIPFPEEWGCNAWSVCRKEKNCGCCSHSRASGCTWSSPPDSERSAFWI